MKLSIQSMIGIYWSVLNAIYVSKKCNVTISYSITWFRKLEIRYECLHLNKLTWKILNLFYFNFHISCAMNMLQFRFEYPCFCIESAYRLLTYIHSWMQGGRKTLQSRAKVATSLFSSLRYIIWALTCDNDAQIYYRDDSWMFKRKNI